MDSSQKTHKDFTIRPVAPEDRDALIALMRETLFGNQAAPDQEDLLKIRAREFIDPPEGSRAFIAVADDKPVAFTYVTPDTKRAGYLVDDLQTLPEYEGHGMASALLESCEQFVRDEGARAIHLNVLETNRPVVDFYARRGWLKESFETAGGNTTDIDPALPWVRTHLMQKNLDGPT